VSLQAHVDHLKAAGGVQRAYKVGAVPKKPQSPYCVVLLDSGTPSTYSNDARSDSLRMVSVQHFGTNEAEVSDMQRRSDLAFRDVPLTYLPHSPMSNRILGTPVVRDPDGEGLLYALHTYRYQEDR